MKSKGEPDCPDQRERQPEVAKSVLDWPGRAGTAQLVLREVEAHLRRRARRRRRLMGMAMVGLVTLGVFWLSRPVGPKGQKPASTLVSQPFRQALPDGSIVELNENGKIDVHYTDTLRRVTLTRGEAHFQVAKDPSHPFVVQAGGVEVRAVGTAFSVQLGSAAVEVLVTEGRVSVDLPASEASARPGGPDRDTRALVDAGNLAVVAKTAVTQDISSLQVQPVSARDLEERLSWRRPRLEFSGTRLQEVVALFFQHSGVRFILADAALGDLELSGVVRADNTEALLLLLKTNFGVVAEYREGNQIVLSKARVP